MGSGAMGFLVRREGYWIRPQPHHDRELALEGIEHFLALRRRHGHLGLGPDGEEQEMGHGLHTGRRNPELPK